MLLRTLLASSVLVYGLIVGITLTAPTPFNAATVTPTTMRRQSITASTESPQQSPSIADDLVVGCAISLHHTDRIDLYLSAINTMVDEIGFTSLEVVTPAFQEHANSPETGIVHGPGAGPHRDQLLAVLRHARARGMHTALMPIVLLSAPIDDEWRGNIRPDNWPHWWNRYTAVVDYFVDIAIDADVDLLSVGSELLATEAQTDRWVGLIRHVRQRYDGLLTYSTNWDHYHVPQFWKHLDVIGMNAYWDMTTDASDPDHPHFDDIVARWRRIRAEVLAFGHRMGKPILYTELGYPSLPWGLRDPWNYVNSDGVPATPAVQALGYSAFLSAWDDLLTDSTSWQPGGFAGTYFFRWDPYHRGDRYTGYGFQGTSTLDLLKAFLQHRRITRQSGR